MGLFSALMGNAGIFSVETAGTFDLDAELKIWISGEAQPSVRKKFNKSLNVFDVQNVLAFHVLK
ncbi:PH domain-containing protein [Pedobacter sp. N36a]|uniref:PH domain-containing protein n=1 Tax=Pedobacter sp. N36a TaxID=2767996 RepID=UPI001CA43D97|nr:PH domain-containing protein [Pedobacter sp. N36a]